MVASRHLERAMNGGAGESRTPDEVWEKQSAVLGRYENCELYCIFQCAYHEADLISRYSF